MKQAKAKSLICGIDPGIDGASCVIETGPLRILRIDALPLDYHKTLKLLDELLTAYGDMQFCLEIQRAMPRQNRTALANMMASYGWLHGALMARGQDVLLVNPLQWQRIVGLPWGTGLGKAPAMGMAMRTFLELAALWRDWPMRKKEGVADAACIALACARLGDGWQLPGKHHVDLDRMGMWPALSAVERRKLRWQRFDPRR